MAPRHGAAPDQQVLRPGPGTRLHSELLDLFQRNPLVGPGEISVLGTPVDLRNVRCDCYVLAGATDHIVPWQACYRIPQLVGGRAEFVLGSSGHVQSIVSPPGGSRASYRTNPRRPRDPQAWLARPARTRQSLSPGARPGARALRAGAVTGVAATRFVDAGGFRIRVSERGRGERPLVLVPGIGTSLEIWPPLLDALGGLHTLAFDPPGAGLSSVPGVPLRLRRLALVVTGVLDALGYEQVDLLGVSWGGALAQQLAHQSPGRLRRLVLAATSCGLGSVPGHPVALAILANPLRFHSRT